MKLLPVCKNKLNSGLTLVEVIVAIGIIAFIFALGALVDVNFYTRELSSKEENYFISVLQKARSRAMNNIDASEHGVHVSDDSYILFSGSSYNSGNPNNEAFPRNENITIASNDFVNGSEVEVIFKQLSGEPKGSITDGNITMSDTDPAHTKTISIKSNGLIDW